MNDELKPCPFCGEIPEHVQNETPVAVHRCAANYDNVRVERVELWQKRPIEDAQSAEVERFEERIATQKALILGYVESERKLNAQLAEAKKALEFYAAARNYDKRDLSSAIPISEIEKDWGTRARAVIENVLEKGGDK